LHSTNGFNATPQFFEFAETTVKSEIGGPPLEIADAMENTSSQVSRVDEFFLQILNTVSAGAVYAETGCVIPIYHVIHYRVYGLEQAPTIPTATTTAVYPNSYLSHISCRWVGGIYYYTYHARVVIRRTRRLFRNIILPSWRLRCIYNAVCGWWGVFYLPRGRRGSLRSKTKGSRGGTTAAASAAVAACAHAQHLYAYTQQCNIII